MISLKEEGGKKGDHFSSRYVAESDEEYLSEKLRMQQSRRSGSEGGEGNSEHDEGPRKK